MQGKENNVNETGTLNMHELAAYMNIGMNAAYDLVKRPGFPAIRIGKRRIITPKKELDKWLQEQAGKVDAE